jgi:hypothetical protein
LRPQFYPIPFRFQYLIGGQWRFHQYPGQFLADQDFQLNTIAIAEVECALGDIDVEIETFRPVGWRFGRFHRVEPMHGIQPDVLVLKGGGNQISHGAALHQGQGV